MLKGQCHYGKVDLLSIRELWFLSLYKSWTGSSIIIHTLNLQNGHPDDVKPVSELTDFAQPRIPIGTRIGKNTHVIASCLRNTHITRLRTIEQQVLDNIQKYEI